LIADMHRSPATFAKRSVSGNTVLVARLAKALRELIGAADAE
jgi:hypothetical protein